MTLVDLYNNDSEEQHEQVLSDGTGSSDDKETLKWATLTVTCVDMSTRCIDVKICNIKW